MKKLLVTLVITFFIGIFSLSVQPTEATTAGVSQQSSTGNANVLIYTAICLIIVLIALIIKRYNAFKGENGNR